MDGSEMKTARNHGQTQPDTRSRAQARATRLSQAAPPRDALADLWTLKPLAESVAWAHREVGMALERMSDDELGQLQRGCAAASQMNCWWAMWELSRWLPREIRNEIARRESLAKRDEDSA
jgi:hypothetical protein